MLFTDLVPLALQEYTCAQYIFEITTDFGNTTENVTLNQCQAKTQEMDPFQNDVGIYWYCIV